MKRTWGSKLTKLDWQTPRCRKWGTEGAHWEHRRKLSGAPVGGSAEVRISFWPVEPRLLGDILREQEKLVNRWTGLGK